MKSILIFFLLTLLFLFSDANSDANSDDTDKSLIKLYPNRKFYPQLQYVTTKQMINFVKADMYNVVDARPTLAYDTLHIIDAVNIPVGDKFFNKKLIKISSKNNKPVVFYCGGLACLKSYKASVKAMAEFHKKNIIREVYTYDSGISSFANNSPGLVLKNGKKISSKNPLLDMKKIKKHAKDAKDFIHLINNDENNQYIILDIREPSQKMLRKLFMFKKEKNITLMKPEKIIEFLNEVKSQDKILMVYGSVEKQIESLYPLIKTSGNRRWFYLEGGEHAYSKYMIEKHVSN